MFNNDETEILAWRKKLFKGLLIAILTWLLIQLISSPVALELGSFFPKDLFIVPGLIATDITYIFLLIFYLYKWGDKWSFITKLKNKVHLHKPIFIKSIISISIAICTYILVTILQEILFKLLPTTNVHNVTTTMLTNSNLGYWSIFVTYLTPLLIAPFFEETIFRGVLGYMFQAFRQPTIGKIIYLLIQSFTFGALHVQFTGSAFSIISSFAMPMISGFIFGIIYLKTKNLTYNIIAHSTYNAITIILLMMF